MEIEKRLTILQNTYAVSVAETVNTYEKLKVLETVVERRKEDRHRQLFESAAGH